MELLTALYPPATQVWMQENLEVSSDNQARHSQRTSINSRLFDLEHRGVPCGLSFAEAELCSSG